LIEIQYFYLRHAGGLMTGKNHCTPSSAMALHLGFKQCRASDIDSRKGLIE
jgi:hypothetical protein